MSKKSTEPNANTVITEATEASTALAQVQSTAVDLSRALHVTTRFATSATLSSNESQVQLRRLTWLTGNNEAYAMNGRQALPPARGWFIDQPDEEAGLYPDDYELMDAMDALCERGLAAPCLVVHQDEARKPKKVASWSLPAAHLFVVCEGVPNKLEMQRDTQTRWGVAYGWNNGKSELHLQCFIKELMDAGYNGVFAVKFSTYCTDKAIACLKAHEYVLRFADKLRAESDELLPYYAYALPISTSVRTITAGHEVGKTKEVHYPVPVIPRLSKNNESLSYLESVAISAEGAFTLEYDGRVERTVEWSVKKSKQIAGLIASDESSDDDDDRPF